jgi:hypothetical protein
MCIPTKKNRKKQAVLAQGLGDEKPDKVEDSCKGSAVVIRLVKLDLAGAEPDGVRPWAVANPVTVFTVTATTVPPDTAVGWTGAQNPTATQAEISRAAVVDDYIVTASLAGTAKSVAVDVVDLLSIDKPSPEVFVGTDGGWKTYDCDTSAKVGATTNPDLGAVWNHLVWSDATVGSVDGKTALVDRTWPLDKANDSTAQIRKATVTLGTIDPKSLSRDIRVCRWPELQLHEVAFPSSHLVANDGVAEIGKVFDRLWKPGRPQPAVNTKTADCQSIVCMHGGAKLNISAKLEVTRKPTDTEKVTIEAKATVGGVDLIGKQEVDVAPGDAYVDFPAKDSDKALKAGVAKGSTLKIDWTMNAPALRHADGHLDPPSAIGTSENLLYVTLKAPTVPGNEMYWTLLDLSCQGADGETTENGFVPAAFNPLKASTGDGRGVRRKGDGVRLSYYKQGYKTAADANTYSTAGILGSLHGTGRCGGWKEVLLHMFNMHGVTSASEFACVRWARNGVDDMKLRFMVNNCDFPGVANALAAPYRNLGVELIKKDGVAGQGKTNPQFDFGDHVTVRHNGQIYDPSYGIGPIPSTLDYETLAIAGFGLLGAAKVKNFTDATPQFISEFVGPHCIYSHKIVVNDTIDSVATHYAGSTADIRALNPTLAGYADDDDLTAGSYIDVILSRTDAVLKWT